MVLRERESRSPPVFIFEPLFLSFDKKRGFFVFKGFGFFEIFIELRDYRKEIFVWEEFIKFG